MLILHSTLHHSILTKCQESRCHFLTPLCPDLIPLFQHWQFNLLDARWVGPLSTGLKASHLLCLLGCSLWIGSMPDSSVSLTLTAASGRYLDNTPDTH